MVLVVDTKLVIDEWTFDISVVGEVAEISEAGEIINIYVDEGVIFIYKQAFDYS